MSPIAKANLSTPQKQDRNIPIQNCLAFKRSIRQTSKAKKNGCILSAIRVNPSINGRVIMPDAKKIAVSFLAYERFDSTSRSPPSPLSPHCRM